VQEVLIVWGDHDQLFPVEKAFAVQRYERFFTGTLCCMPETK
jgi:hypothetical protein